MNFSEKIIDYKDIGEIILKRSSKARKLSISVRPFEGIRVSVPLLVSFSKAEFFIAEKEQWIRNALQKIQAAENAYTVFDRNTQFRTVEHTLEIKNTNDPVPKIRVHDKKIIFYYPDNRDIREKGIQEMIRWGIEAAWRKEAKKYLPARLSELARRHGFMFNKAIIKNNKSRWGSCSHMGNINLSLHLMRLPAHLVDYVLLHELVHTVHQNHSKKFWKLLDKSAGEAKLLDKELKKYRTDIY